MSDEYVRADLSEMIERMGVRLDERIDVLDEKLTALEERLALLGSVVEVLVGREHRSQPFSKDVLEALDQAQGENQ